MDFFRTKSKVHLSTWDEKKLVMLEVVPAIEGAAKGQPQAGEVRYDKDKKCNISFSVEEAFKAAFALKVLANGGEFQYKKMADTSKVAGATAGEIKQLTFDKGAKGGVLLSIKCGDRSISTVLGNDEAYAISKYFEIKAGGYL